LSHPSNSPPLREMKQGLRVLLSAASVIVIIAGLRASQSFAVPIVAALFLSLLCLPPMSRLEKMGVPNWLAIIIVMTVATIFVVLITAVVGSSVRHFQDQIPEYRERLDDVVGRALTWLQARGADVEASDLTEKINTGALMELVASTAGGLLSILSNLFLVVITMIFMLFEASCFKQKLRLAKGDPDADLSEFAFLSERVQKYLAIKAYVSFGTGVCVTVLCLALGVDFPFLWGLIAFLFNFVPNIGSIIAAVPAVLLALLQLGPGAAVALGVGYIVINLVIGNVVEPKLMGRRLGLSTLVVFLSLIFWGWIWGPVGMLLSVPLTVIVKIMLEHSEDYRWLAILLGPGDDEPPPLPRAAQTIALSRGAPAEDAPK
jgi:AI-2 transport protein TqsA